MSVKYNTKKYSKPELNLQQIQQRSTFTEIIIVSWTFQISFVAFLLLVKYIY